MKKLLILMIALLPIVVTANNRLPQDDEKYYQMKEVDQKITITFKPRPPASRSCAGEMGKVALRVYFHKSEKISRTEIVSSSLCDDFDRNAVVAAKQIEFKAAVKGGRAVSSVAIVEYSWLKY